MMKKTNSSPFRKVKILLILPVVAMLFYAFAKPEYVSALPSQPNGGSLINQVNAGKKVTGTVLKPDGTPLPGTSVIISGTSVGTMADPNGKFELSDVREGADLAFSFVGYRTQLVKADAGKPMVINMQRESIGMDQVTVVGYGSMDATTLRAEKINVRGIDSENPPLIILNGKVIEKKQMDEINPSSIESISVLKDKSATETYGEKAKNGVIVITTKKDNASANPQEPRKTDLTDKSGKPVFMVVEEMPEFPGGELALRKFIADAIKYPTIAQQNGIQGKVYVNFIVGSDGKVQSPKIARGVDPILDKEALRVVNTLPDWKPGKQKGEAVSVSYTLPITFALNTETAGAKTSESGEKTVFVVVEQMPEFPGGQEALMRYIASSIKYPAIAQQNGIQGKVFVKFVIGSNGKVQGAAIARGVDPILDQEALRVVNSLPAWKPGQQRGQAVDVEYVLPVEFKLQ